ncbi:MAG: glycosyltransferase [Cyclobacteriaceae bacterium]
MIVFFAVVFGFYFLLLIFLLIGMRLALGKKNGVTENQKIISVIIPFRNEEKNIDLLLTSLKNQSYSPDAFEIIIIDDHSEDNSFEKAKRWLSHLNNLLVIKLEAGSGKKAAISKGISISKGEISCYN